MPSNPDDAAPIVLFVYNRPTHTIRTVEALLKNALAKKSNLFIYSDAPKQSKNEDAVRDVRAYIKTILSTEAFKSWNEAALAGDQPQSEVA